MKRQPCQSCQPDLFGNPALPPAIPSLAPADRRELIQLLGRLLEEVLLAERAAPPETNDE